MEFEELWMIRRVGREDIKAALAFIVPMLGEVYPNIPNVAERWDLAHMEEAYVRSERSVMMAAFDMTGTVVGTAAIQPYDDRIDSVKGQYDIETTAELSRCYVSSELRRRGIARQIIRATEEHCRSYGYQKICLHTHKFLPGGFPFWLSQGYEIRLDRGDELETVYMDKTL